jgi:vitamin B12 transporter
LLLSPAALSQPLPKAAALDPVVVTAARGPQSLDDLVADVTVIGPEEIARSGAGSLASLLSRQPGIEIVTNGSPGSTSGVFIRGANRQQTVVLLDGLRIESSSAGAASLEAIPLEQIERIEILRGPASSLYGADAIGGVIQVFTRAAARRSPPTRASATARTRRRSRAPACRAAAGRCATPCRSAAAAATGSAPRAGRRRSASTRTATTTSRRA